MRRTMRKTIPQLGVAAALGLGLMAAPAFTHTAFAQNMEGPGASNYGAGSSPQTGGIVAAPQSPAPGTPAINNRASSAMRHRPLYNSMRGAPNQTGAGGARGDNNDSGRR